MEAEREPRHAPDVARTYATERVEVTWAPERCTHVGRCFRSLPDVFSPAERPWVRPEAADPDALSEVVMSCPTGALGFRRLDGGPQETDLVGEGVQMRALRSGPMDVRGRVSIVDAQRRTWELTRVRLCRCGASRNKPFCDDSHFLIGFKDPEDD